MCVSIIKVSAPTQDLKDAIHEQKEKFNHISPAEELKLVKTLKMLLNARFQERIGAAGDCCIQAQYSNNLCQGL